MKQVSLFAGLNIQELRLIADIVEETEEDQGEIVFNQGEPGDSMYMIIEGGVQIVLADGTPVKTLSTFEAFGEMALIDDEPRSATAKAVAPCKFLRIDRDRFVALLGQYPEISMGLLRMMSRRIRSELAAAPAVAHQEEPGMAFRQ
ncbi:MAG: hypothetical protein A3I06_08995 [Candidatus Lindowbacteria bacterium RIFCSPLOWO2_02_FULL_62_12]|nr:MAG: hypothetical protein A3I06_08995 [Candidatus Lindowbacteria bacterium RIFCSPLOWO2_02_FULL_62_12]